MSTISKSLSGVIKKHAGGAVIMMELPANTYFQANLESVKTLISNGFEGLYISFHRPFNNISTMLEQQGININKLLFIDVASSFGNEASQQHERCVHISPAIEIDDLVRAIYTSMSQLKSPKQFIFVDSLTTITLYKPLSETMRFSEFLIRTVRSHEVSNISLVFNVASDLAQKKFIQDIALHVDQVITVKK